MHAQTQNKERNYQGILGIQKVFTYPQGSGKTSEINS